MGPQWFDVREVPFAALALLEPFQLQLLLDAPAEVSSLAIALSGHPDVAVALRLRCPEAATALDALVASVPSSTDAVGLRRHELRVLGSIQDWLLYALEPRAYDALPFLGWDSQELLQLADFRDRRVLDVGAGTGRLTFTVADVARSVHAAEPVGALRAYLREKAARLGFRNVYASDGLITNLPHEDSIFDITLAGHVFGDAPEAEYAELVRVTRSGGLIALVPGNGDKDNERHAFLVAHDFAWAHFEEPSEGWVRKYWKRLPC